MKPKLKFKMFSFKNGFGESQTNMAFVQLSSNVDFELLRYLWPSVATAPIVRFPMITVGRKYAD